jgi:hypothetical protein
MDVIRAHKRLFPKNVIKIGTSYTELLRSEGNQKIKIQKEIKFNAGFLASPTAIRFCWDSFHNSIKCTPAGTYVIFRKKHLFAGAYYTWVTEKKN